MRTLRRLSFSVVFAGTVMLALAGCNSNQPAQQNAAPVVASSPGPAAQSPRTPSAPAPEAPAAASTSAHYQDSSAGVSFDYPNVWSSSTSAPGYLGGEVPNDYGTPKAAVSFSPKGNLYENTLLTSLVFTYSTKHAKSAAACSEGLQGNMTPSKPVTINGTQYTEFAGDDAGMCHEQSSIVDVTYDATHNRCLAFERDFNTECWGAGDNKRRITPEEIKALQRHLDAIMQSVAVHF